MDRSNAQWLQELRSGGPERTAALEDLRAYLERGVFFYLRSDRSDMRDRPDEELQQMAQDFVQDALLKVLDNLDSFRGESRFLTWCTKIATRVAITELRRVRWQNYSLDHLTAGGEVMPRLTDLALAPDSALPPERHAEREEVLRIIDDAFNTLLTDRQRLALSAYLIDGVNVEEIARQMGSNRNAIYKVVYDARVKLKRAMEEQGLTLEYILALFST